ncbi:hypothetical protein N8524_06350 [Candidatus Puniceispirillum sp.]|nr:hypothetical protein [Candidatus Puniceispirillum sp.]
MTQNPNTLTTLSKLLLYAGIGIICIILAWVFVAGSWSRTPDIIQTWGNFLRPIGDIPIIGNFAFMLWGIFLVPGLLCSLAAQKLSSNEPESLSSVGNPNQPIKINPDNRDTNSAPECWSEQELETAKKVGLNVEKLKSATEKISDEKFSKAKIFADNLWRRELDGKYGQILRHSEILDDGENFYFYYKRDAERHCLIGWNKSKRVWFSGVCRDELEGLNFAPTKMFDEAAFPEKSGDESYRNKQLFINYIIENTNE